MKEQFIPIKTKTGHRDLDFEKRIALVKCPWAKTIVIRDDGIMVYDRVMEDSE